MLTSITTTGPTLANSYWPNPYIQRDTRCPGCGRPKKCPCCGEPMDMTPVWRYPVYPEVIC